MAVVPRLVRTAVIPMAARRAAVPQVVQPVAAACQATQPGVPLPIAPHSAEPPPPVRHPAAAASAAACRAVPRRAGSAAGVEPTAAEAPEAAATSVEAAEPTSNHRAHLRPKPKLPPQATSPPNPIPPNMDQRSPCSGAGKRRERACTNAFSADSDRFSLYDTECHSDAQWVGGRWGSSAHCAGY